MSIQLLFQYICVFFGSILALILILGLAYFLLDFLWKQTNFFLKFAQIARWNHEINSWKKKGTYPKNETEWQALVINLMIDKEIDDVRCGNESHNFEQVVSIQTREVIRKDVTNYLSEQYPR